jgi:hypothetical protein
VPLMVSELPPVLVKPPEPDIAPEIATFPADAFTVPVTPVLIKIDSWMVKTLVELFRIVPVEAQVKEPVPPVTVNCAPEF